MIFFGITDFTYIYNLRNILFIININTININPLDRQIFLRFSKSRKSLIYSHKNWNCSPLPLDNSVCPRTSYIYNKILIIIKNKFVYSWDSIFKSNSSKLR